MSISLKDLSAIDQNDYKPLYAQLSEALAEYIRTKGLKPGDPLPSESDLVQHYGISRMTVRLAIQRLATEGLLKKVQGKGTFVAELKLSGVIRGIRSFEDSMAEQGIRVVNELIEASVEQPTHLWLNELQLPAGSRTYKIRRLKKREETPLCIEVRNFPLDIAAMFTPEELNSVPAVDLMNRKPETEVHHVRYRIVTSVLLERESEVLAAPVDSPVLIQFMTHLNSAMKPVMTGRLTFLAERAEIRFETHRNGLYEKTIRIK